MRFTALAVALAALGCASRLTAADDGWIDLLRAGPDGPWKQVADGWIFASDVALDPDNPARLKATPAAGGPIWVNGEKGVLPDLLTKAAYGDAEVHVEFLIGKRSNSGVKFHALYELQIYDSAGKPADKLTGNDCGGIYPRAELLPRYKYLDNGVPPRVNAAKPPGEWQTLDAVFLAPRFNEKGEKAANARIVKAVLNGAVIHEDVELKTPTGHNYTKKEGPTGPLMLQTDHGPVAVRSLKIRALEKKEN